MELDYKPKLIVFDLDYTLWPFWVDTHVTPPFHKDRKGVVRDQSNCKVKLYPDSKNILEKLHEDGYKIAIASRTSCTSEANQLLDLFNLDKYISYKEIYAGCKLTHFSRFHKDSKIDYSDMIFFDDEYRNIRDLSEIGVTCVYIEETGMTWQYLKNGFQLFQEKHNK